MAFTATAAVLGPARRTMAEAVPAVASGRVSHGVLALPSGPRTYTAYVPKTAPLRDAPVVLVLHGYGGSGDQAMAQGRWAAAADRHGFIVLAPDGRRPDPNRRASFLSNARSWNAGAQTGTWASQASVDDSGFLRALLLFWIASNRVTSGRVYVTGFSNGAGMAFRTAADLSDIVAAVAPVSNGLLLPVARLARPVPLMLVWGDADPINPIAGGTVRRNHEIVVRPSAQASFDRWSALIGCTGAPTREAVGPGVGLIAHRSCGADAEALFYTVAGLGHQWPGGESYLQLIAGPNSRALDATELIWDFFARHGR